MPQVNNEQPPYEAAAEDSEVTGRVLAIHGAQSLVEIDDSLYRCQLSGRLKHDRHNRAISIEGSRPWERQTSEIHGRWERSRVHIPPSSPIAVGDLVRVRPGSGNVGLIMDRLERRTWLGRVRPSKGPQIIAANVDIALVVLATAQPTPDLFLLDQFLVQATTGDMIPWVVFNKVDLLNPNAPRHLPEEGFNLEDQCAIYRNAGYTVFLTSALTGIGIDRLNQSLKGKTAVLAGPSGVGKSQLLNQLAPKSSARIGEISEWSGRGQHTTTHVSMYPLSEGGYLVDAPGIRRLELWQVAADQLWTYFPEFAPFVKDCKYHGCAHLDEDGCAIRSAAESGVITQQRYHNYRTMRQK